MTVLNRYRIAAAFILILNFCLLSSFVFAQNSKHGRNENFYERVVAYFDFERSGSMEKAALSPLDYFIVQGADLAVSLICLWAALLVLAGSKDLVLKKYLWFLCAYNIAWVVILALFSFSWNFFSFLVLRLRPQLDEAFINFFSIMIIVSSCLIYVWILARTFQLSLWGACGVFFITHIFYFLIFVSFSLVAPSSNDIYPLINNNLGLRPSVRAYLSEVHRISLKFNMSKIIRLRTFRI